MSEPGREPDIEVDNDLRMLAGVGTPRGICEWTFADRSRRAATGEVRGRKCGW